MSLINKSNKIYSKNSNRFNVLIIYIFILIAISLISTLIISFDNDKPTYYNLLPLLPISFGLISCVFANIYNYFFRSISVTIIIATYFMRLVIVPVFMSFGGYTSKITNTEVLFYVDNAILLMIFEMIIVFSLLALSVSKLSLSARNVTKKIKIKEQFISKSLIFKIFLFGLISFEILVLFLHPEVASYVGLFTQFSEQGRLEHAIQSIYVREIVPGLIFTLFTFIFNILQLIIPILCIQFINLKFGKANTKFAVNLSIFVVFLTGIIMTSEKANSILIALSLFLIIYNIYPTHIRKKIPFFVLFFIVLVFAGLIFKSGANSNNNFLSSISTILNAYFSGPANVAVSFLMRDDININIFLSDIGNSIPFIKFFFQDLMTTPKLFNYTLYGNTNFADQIIPMIGQGYFYFGFLLSPILACLFIKLALLFEKKGNRESNVFSKYIYIFISIGFASGPILYSLNIMIGVFCTQVIYILIVKISSKKKRNKIRYN